jgi:osmotically-inducible protein OsmY
MSDDKQLKHDVLAELSWEPSVSQAHIGVTARGGVVTLSGHVDNYVEKQAAARAARRVKGVKAVAQEIEVRLPSDMTRGDDDIAAAAVNGLAWNVTVPNDVIKVKVEKGWVTLTGEVDWHYQKLAAAHAVHGLFGVTGVSDEIKIKPQIDVSDVSDNIMHALHRSWFFDPKTVTVEAKGGDVHLTGTVHSWHDRQVATDTAWAAPGATSVRNDIVIA